MKIKRWQLLLIIILLIAFSAVCIYAAIQMFTGAIQLGKDGSYENGWSKNIITKIVDGDVPIPDGFEYVSGTKSTGVIIKNSETGALYIWIPTSLEGGEIEDYETKVSEIFGGLTESLSSELLENISTYGGFYVGISGQGVIDIAGMTEEEYKLAREKANELYGDSKSVSSILVDSELLVSGYATGGDNTGSSSNPYAAGPQAGLGTYNGNNTSGSGGGSTGGNKTGGQQSSTTTSNGNASASGYYRFNISYRRR